MLASTWSAADVAEEKLENTEKKHLEFWGRGRVNWRLLHLIKSLCKDKADSHSHMYKNLENIAYMSLSWENLLDEKD